MNADTDGDGLPDLPRAASHREQSERKGSTEMSW